MKDSLFWLGIFGLTVLPAFSAAPPYKDAAQPVDLRVSDLLSRMTMEEKIGQLAQGSGGMLFADMHQPITTVADQLREGQKRYRTTTRLGIPALVGCEALHGLMLRPCTIYPQAIGLGATWDPALVKEMAAEIAQEAAAAGISQILAPVLDLGRDPRYGRTEETYGECPTLVSRMGVAYITGAQGNDAQDGLAPDKVYCMTKHFAGYSIPANGLNIAPVLIGEREMRTLHLIPFEQAVKKGHVMAVMPSYNSVDSVPNHANPWLLRTVLREEWGFRGYVYSDWEGIDFLVGHRVAASAADAGLLAIQSGVDMEAPESKSYQALPGFVRKGELAESLLDEAVARVLRAKFLAGLFDGRRSDGDPARVAKAVHTPDHIATSRKLAEEGIILLKNDGECCRSTPPSSRRSPSSGPMPIKLSMATIAGRNPIATASPSCKLCNPNSAGGSRSTTPRDATWSACPPAVSPPRSRRPRKATWLSLCWAIPT